MPLHCDNHFIYVLEAVIVSIPTYFNMDYLLIFGFFFNISMNICQLKIRVAGEKWRPRKQKKIADEAVSFFKAD